MPVDDLLDDPTLRPWLVDAADFPTGGTTSDVLEFAVAYAVLAPSPHNTQPWRFVIDGDSLDVALDPSRALVVTDPEDREATISAGAALEYVTIALTHFGFGSQVVLLPDAMDPAVCARVTIVKTDEEPADNDVLFAQIPRRRTSRLPFSDEPLDRDDLDALVATAELRQAHLRVVTEGPDKTALAELVSRADRDQMRDARFRRELASWLRPNATTRADGMRGYRIGLTELQSMAAPLIVRAFDIGAGRAAHDHELAELSPALAVLWSDDDDPQGWINAGRALARVLLTARARDIWAGFLDQPIELASMREDVARVIGPTGHPQVLLRLGHGAEPRPQPRRAPGEFVVRRGRPQ